jgi:hypothetical protein
MGRYQELIDSSITYDLRLLQAASENARSIEDLQVIFNDIPTPSLDMLNTRYLIINPDAPPLLNNNSSGNSWFVEKPIMVENANMEILKLKTIDPSKEVVIDVIFNDMVSKSSYPVESGEWIELVSYQPNELNYNYTAQSEKLAVFSEIYYPAGWKCFIDGTESRYFRANYVLRAMILPEGDHEIKFVFEPSSYIIGNKVSLAGSLVFILIVAVYFVLTLKKKPKSF